MKKKRTRRLAQPSERSFYKYASVIGGLVLLALCMNVKSSGNKPRSDHGSNSTQAAFAGEAALPVLPITTTAAGQWQIAGAHWNFAIHTVPATEVVQILRQPPGGWDATGTAEPEHLAVLELFQSRLQRLENSHGMEVFGSDSRAFKVRVFSKTDNPAVLGGHVAYPRGADWTVLSVKPARRTAIRQPHRDLLPLPESIRRICTRVGQDGQTQCDVVATSDSVRKLAEFWRSAGWEVHRPTWAQEHGNILYCKSGERLVQVTIQPVAGQDQRVLVLVSADLAQPVSGRTTEH